MSGLGLCPCARFALLSEKPPRPNREQSERGHLARMARQRGWVPPGRLSDREALTFLRGQGGRSAELRKSLTAGQRVWDRRPALESMLGHCKEWFAHLQS